MASRPGGRSTMKKRSSHRERRSSRSSRSSLILPLTLFGEPASLTGEPTRIGERGPTSDPIPARLAGEPGRLAGEPDRLTGGPGLGGIKGETIGPGLRLRGLGVCICAGSRKSTAETPRWRTC